MDMRTLLSKPYIPFGTQYYRAPSPYPADWERDLASIASSGFNTVKFWAQWRWNNPAEGVFMFNDIDRLMDLAHRNGLRVMLNAIVDVAPVWIYQKYADASMVTLDGRKIGPQTQPHRQIGGLGLCLNHDAAMEHLFEFLRTTVRRYKDHPALEMWNVGSEPELTSSMAELRLYADDASRMGDMLCYCSNCERAFKAWLRKKYMRVDALNDAWNRNYQDFRDVELPRTRNSFNDIIDWRMFFVDTLGRNVRRRFEVAREEDQGAHPLLCHHVFIQGFPVTSTASDPWNVGQYGDLHGFTQMDDPMMCDVLRSCAKGKPVISAEMLMLFGYTLDLPASIGMNDIKRYIFTGVASNLKGFIFWQYRPEILAREAPTWGLTFLDGSPTPWLRSFAEVNRVIQKNASFLLDAHASRAPVAILYNPENQVFGWAATGNEKTVTDSLLGTHRALYENNFVVDFLHPREMGVEMLRNYRVLIVPFPYVLSAQIAEVIAKWVQEGGIVIGESYFGGWNIELGRHQTIIPGYGLHEVFGARQGVVTNAGPRGEVEIELAVDLPYLRKGEKAVGGIVKETLVPDRAAVLARFADGEPAITMASSGAGHAILIGSYVGLLYQRVGHQVNGLLLASLIDYATAIDRPRVAAGTKVRVDVLRDPQDHEMLILRNLEPHDIEASIDVPSLHHDLLTEQFTGEVFRLARRSDGCRGQVRLLAGEVKVYRD